MVSRMKLAGFLQNMYHVFYDSDNKDIDKDNYHYIRDICELFDVKKEDIMKILHRDEYLNKCTKYYKDFGRLDYIDYCHATLKYNDKSDMSHDWDRDNECKKFKSHSIFIEDESIEYLGECIDKGMHLN